MASVLQVATIKDQGGNNNAIEIANSSANVTVNNLAAGTIGSGVTFPAGHVIQVKRNNIAPTTNNYNEFSFSSDTPTVPSLSSNNLEVTGFSASSGNILFVTWNYGLLETANGNVILTGFKVGSTFYATNFFQGGAGGNGLGRYNCTVTGSITLGSALSNATISACVQAPNNTSSRLLHYAYSQGSPTHDLSITVMEIKQ